MRECYDIKICYKNRRDKTVTDIILEIHHINVGTGDATLIVVRDPVSMKNKFTTHNVALPTSRYEWLKVAMETPIDLKGTVLKSQKGLSQTVLIDAGNDSSKAFKIERYLNEVGVTELGYVLTSHYHQDHLGGYPYLLGPVKNATGAKAFDRGDGFPKGSSNFAKYRDSIKGYTLIPVPAPSPVGKHIDTSIKLETGNMGQQLKLTCIATDTAVLNGSKVTGASNQNDFGLAWLLQYGAFSYLTSGDLSGFNNGNYVDMETPMIQQVATLSGSAHVCACKLNHHGSRESSNPYFLSIIQPRTAVISVGDKKYGNNYHPHEEVIEDLEAPQWDVSSWSGKPHDNRLNTIQHYYVTSLRKNLGNPRDQIGMAGKGKIGGDIVIIVDDTKIDSESRYAVYWNGKKPGNVVKNDKDMRGCTPKGIYYYVCH